jgi:hypothetical protein
VGTGFETDDGIQGLNTFVEMFLKKVPVDPDALVVLKKLPYGCRTVSEELNLEVGYLLMLFNKKKTSEFHQGR